MPKPVHAVTAVSQSLASILDKQNAALRWCKCLTRALS